MTLARFWTMISGKQIVWDERARGRDKLAQKWVNAVTGEVESEENRGQTGRFLVFP